MDRPQDLVAGARLPAKGSAIPRSLEDLDQVHFA
jgi:hypothetical protein